ncbi:MAG: sigma-70 family RNA polymerase sigma factor [Verrucomicrobia bacterium]|nr:sigma-70 family RNA polymerase sigma factor [Verrucomicrobiota bacterium]
MDAERLVVQEVLVPHLDAAYNLARWLVERDKDAQEIVGESYLQALKRFGTRGPNPRAWLLTIVRNTAYKWLKKHPSDLSATAIETPASTEFTLPSSLGPESENQGRLVWEALKTMPIELREVLLLYEFEHWSYKELAANLKLPVDLVTTRLNSARQRLRRAIAEAQEKGLLDEL